MIMTDAVLKEILDKICTQPQSVIKEKQLLAFGRSQGLAKILFGNVKNLNDLFILFQFTDPVRRQFLLLLNRGFVCGSFRKRKLTLTLMKLPAVLAAEAVSREAETEETVCFCPSGESSTIPQSLLLSVKSRATTPLCPVFQCTENISLGTQQTICHLLQTERNRSIGE